MLILYSRKQSKVLRRQRFPDGKIKLRLGQKQKSLFPDYRANLALPKVDNAEIPNHFQPKQIILTKGSLSTPEREHFVRRICSLFPQVPIHELLQISHNQVNLGQKDELKLHRKGKQILVFGELKNAVRFSEERDNTCPNYWHFSPYSFCPYDCQYCYLAGTPGVKYSPTVKIYVNLPEMLHKIEKIASNMSQATAFYIGKLQDPLALDPLTAYSKKIIPFFSRQTMARLILLTKSDQVKNLINLEHRARTILSWSLNPAEVSKIFEKNIPFVEKRIEAMKKCSEAGYPVRAVIMPIIPIKNWPEIYGRFLDKLLSTITLQRITLGGICIYSYAKALMERKLGRNNIISCQITTKSVDGRHRYSMEKRINIYTLLIKYIRRLCPDLEIALCLEELPVWEACGLVENIGKCNCNL